MLTLLRRTLKLHGKLGDMKSPICVTNKKINMFMICGNNCIHSVYYHTDKFYKPINHSRVHCVGGLKASLFSLCISRVFFLCHYKTTDEKKRLYIIINIILRWSQLCFRYHFKMNRILCAWIRRQTLKCP